MKLQLAKTPLEEDHFNYIKRYSSVFAKARTLERRVMAQHQVSQGVLKRLGAPLKVDFDEYCMGLNDNKPHRASPVHHNLLISKLPSLKTLVEPTKGIAPLRCTSEMEPDPKMNWMMKKNFKLIQIDIHRARKEARKSKLLKIADSSSTPMLPIIKSTPSPRLPEEVIGVSLTRNQSKLKT